ncbi:hypothetical protein BOTBODRAFT_148028 [Botryobasidium botryosum FD-172 SS1]|uniref:Uncharacterized protein n=1 Tax=Botryobasidium botryosum (strain FD-172 SS1) TaxID=930990 RepID=A0A067M518_BOTB1|nr:hypothetical protein BOTBODRAFT_148028 [Botryobasidium botryosum FD-172 SS1]
MPPIRKSHQRSLMGSKSVIAQNGHATPTPYFLPVHRRFTPGAPLCSALAPRNEHALPLSEGRARQPSSGVRAQDLDDSDNAKLRELQPHEVICHFQILEGGVPHHVTVVRVLDPWDREGSVRLKVTLVSPLVVADLDVLRTTRPLLRQHGRKEYSIMARGEALAYIETLAGTIRDPEEKDDVIHWLYHRYDIYVHGQVQRIVTQKYKKLAQTDVYAAEMENAPRTRVRVETPSRIRVWAQEEIQKVQDMSQENEFHLEMRMHGLIGQIEEECVAKLGMPVEE